MESIPCQLPAGRDSTSSPSSKQELQPYSGTSSLKPNQVSETALYGVPIVSLVIDGQERLCLAQISNTLLKNYSYNEIHNRRVALGITCVQCTPVQLEILRRAGAMPISSRRCGMITKREAERLYKNSSEDVAHAWEDVKAMFNGGSRKRTLPMNESESSSPLKPQGPSNLPQRASPEVPHKALRCDEDRGSLSLANGVRSYPVIPVPSKSFGMLQKIPPPLFPHPYGFPAFGLCQKKDDGVGMGEQNKTNLSGVFWPAPKDSVYPSFPMFWPTAGSLPMPSYPQSQPKPPTELINARQNELDMSEQSDRSTNTPKDSVMDSERCSSTQSTRNEEDKSGDETRSMEGVPTPRKMSYISAFRPVVKDAESIAKLYGNRDTYTGARSGYLSPDFMSESSSYRSVSPDVDSVDEPDVDVESNRAQEDEESIQLSVEDRQSPPALALSQASPQKSRESEAESVPAPQDPQRASFTETAPAQEEMQSEQVAESNKNPSVYEVYTHERDDLIQPLNAPSTFGSTTNYQCGSLESNVIDPNKEDIPSTAEEREPKTCYQGGSGVTKEGQRELDGGEEAGSSDVRRVHLIEKDIEKMAKDELQKQLVEQVELRKKLEREFQSLKDNFQDQMKRELSCREEMVQQLQIVRDTLCSELDQERKARYAIQQKLKEAHDALHHFSCKMLTPRHCTGTCSFKPPLLPP
ncbi:hypothetical protein MATL_G00094870 [Megalops atlanticus]|uniref:SKI/SNO/DAC domain-containing protein n=1 Tax=Megalops atlanticus TaxID=7932 RepID=A0A9D3Q5V0_MEGAT|nr:hypothetical protein MATL_G00094870 [Megalops atlanticus]